MLPNSQEVSITIIGPKSLRVKMSLAGSGNVSKCKSSVGDFRLRVVESYRHMGTQFNIAGDSRYEIAIRCAHIYAKSRDLLKVISQPSISQSRKKAIVSAYLFGGGLFQCGTWSELSPASYTKMHHCIMSVYRKIDMQCFKDIDTLASDNWIIDEYNLISPVCFVSCARLQLLQRVYKNNVLSH